MISMISILSNDHLDSHYPGSVQIEFEKPMCVAQACKANVLAVA
jgi:hypothetical protein